MKNMLFNTKVVPKLVPRLTCAESSWALLLRYSRVNCKLFRFNCLGIKWLFAINCCCCCCSRSSCLSGATRSICFSSLVVSVSLLRRSEQKQSQPKCRQAFAFRALSTVKLAGSSDADAVNLISSSYFSLASKCSSCVCVQISRIFFSLFYLKTVLKKYAKTILTFVSQSWAMQSFTR